MSNSYKSCRDETKENMLHSQTRASCCRLVALRSALDHIELTYHDVTVFAIRDFKTLEVLKNYFL